MLNADVVLLHGLGRNSSVMAKMAQHLALQGYRVANLDYPSTRYCIETLVDDYIAPRITAFRTDASRPLYLVAHSLGAIIAHVYIKKYAPQHLGRVVTTGPPYHGSAVIDHLGKYRWYQALHGPAALQLTTQESGICHRLGAVDYELGVIAGNRWFFVDWFFARYWLRQPNDGKVEVASTHISGCRDHLILPVDHVFFPTYPAVIHQAVYFLQHGYFDPTIPTSIP